MHPMIKPSLRRGWRDRQTVRFGVTPAHSVLLGPVDSATQSFLALLDGTRALSALRDAATSLGLGRGAADRLAERLAAAGVLDDATADREAAAQVTDGLRPDLASLSLLHPRPGAGLAALVARRGMRVQVRGAGRVGTAVATALSQAGVGTVDVVDGGRVEPEDTAPGGLRAEHIGRRRAAAARSLVRTVVPWRREGEGKGGNAGKGGDAGEAAKGGGTRLVILAPRDGLAAYVPDPAAAEELITAGMPHLYTGVVEATGFVGPLVLPGASACAGCLLRRRAAREPCWPLLVAQWRNARWPGVPACDGPLATAVAGLAACTALGFLDGTVPPSASTRTELALPRLSATTETIEPHQECSCGAATTTRPP
ncbi:ThiF family adenylyltransferase [Streptomyces sp. PT12]|uniref:ThiF family adenylyltransferase n=1 Tax=Streptomyces sp. PT12 TaxID=1510197 RepID=UPI000DE3DACC|nr:ThiF family adenylyltransferase [Streptomyces sp. PT12]RBM11898.1 hypothetical protein DEH69_21730 [Streptomyces sp. PT12]